MVEKKLTSLQTHTRKNMHGYPLRDHTGNTVADVLKKLVTTR
jgi:hypothetical protein